jgi:glucosamine--fructose-6-phosphate aminotransferase (isomerizing)
MCGIAGFVGNQAHATTEDLSWLSALAKAVKRVPMGDDKALTPCLDTLFGRFGPMMSFSTHAALAGSGAALADATSLGEALRAQGQALLALSAAGRTDVDPVIERVRDLAWQVDQELVAGLARVDALLPPGEASRRQRYAAWGTEIVLQAIDRLEVRGRDSAGIAVQLLLDRAFDASELPAAVADQLARRSADPHAGHLAVALGRSPEDHTVAVFLYKTARLIGRLGDNCATLREAIRADAVFWALSRSLAGLTVLAHTRWASNGVISVPNCHPVNGSLAADGPGLPGNGPVFVLNGDVDNYGSLVAAEVTARQRVMPTDITTDSKIIPVLYRLDADHADPLDAFRRTIARLEGSLAVAALTPEAPHEALLAQRGSGQGLHAAQIPDGWFFASEVYGLASLTRSAISLARGTADGLVCSLDARNMAITARAVSDGRIIELAADPIDIYPRDIYRGSFDYYLAKEIHEAPSSVRKTLRGRYRRDNGAIDFDGLAMPIWSALRKRVTTGRPIRRIITTGQGTAAMAAAGAAFLIERALAGQGIRVEARKASELSASLGEERLDDTLVLAISQSGTTTDTNRAVDLARERGAFVHAIVNRRNSDLVRKANSHLFTSDGRDVEMSVASTKAYYSQIAAAKLTALCLADALGAMPAQEIAREISQLESLPDVIESVLARDAEIGECAHRLAPASRNWAVVGNGTNKIAADEVRIKISELCYKSVPVDFTEDKKHIDLSTEPLTIVLANDLPSNLVGDTAKEVAIFKAHNGKPIVFVAAGEEKAFLPYAQVVVALPPVGAGLDFVIGVVAGHLWGFHAARAIDETALTLRLAMGAVAKAAEEPNAATLAAAVDQLGVVLDLAAEGRYDSGLGSRHIALLAKAVGKLAAAPPGRAALPVLDEVLATVKAAFEETSRPIDTIRHQAKTVTVGTSRPEDSLSPQIVQALASLEVKETELRDEDRRRLIALSWLVAQVPGAALVPTADARGKALDRVSVKARFGTSPKAARRHESPRRPDGLLGLALREQKLQLSGIEGEASLFLPVYRPEDWTTRGIVVLTLELVQQSSASTKAAALRALELYDPLAARFEQTTGGDFMQEIGRRAPVELLFGAP